MMSHNRSRVLRVVFGLAALMLVVVSVGCSGGGDDTTTTVAPAGPGATLASVGGPTTTDLDFDELSSFKPKDPFVPQAQATTTTSTPVTAPPTTAPPTTAPPTTAPPTTIETHELQVTVFWPDGTISIRIDDFNFSRLHEDAVLDGDWGSIEVTIINNVAAPYTVTFTRDGSDSFTLELNETESW